MINYYILELEEFKSTDLRYNRTSDEILYIRSGVILVEMGHTNLALYEDDVYKIPAKKLHKISAITDAKVFISYCGEKEDLVIVEEDKNEEHDTCPKQLSFSWKE